MRRLALAILAAVPGFVAPAAAEGPVSCRQETDDARRLACYDRLFGEGAARETPVAPATSAGVKETPPDPAKASLVPPTAASPLSAFWELDPADKRGTFAVRTYMPNFFLPAHFTSGINRVPESPTHPARRPSGSYRTQEAKLQISLRAKVAQDVLLPGADLWFAYTQRSLWQLWNREDSAPFRSSDYQPEAIYVVPVPASLGTLPAGWRLRMLQFGIAHQSNGQSDPLSRSWNYVHAGGAVERGNVSLQMRAYRRLAEGGVDDNPDIIRRLGNTEFTAAWLPGLSTASLTWRTHTADLSRGSVQLDWTYPVNRSKPAGLRWYLQLFSGYGETLLDYNHRQNSVGLGLTLFNF